MNWKRNVNLFHSFMVSRIISFCDDEEELIRILLGADTQDGTSNVAMSKAVSFAGVAMYCQVSHHRRSKRGGDGTPRGARQGTAGRGEPWPGSILLLMDCENETKQHY